MKKILVPCDFSSQSVEAFKFAIALAKITKAKVIALHVTEIPVYFGASIDVQFRTFDAALLQELDINARKNFAKLLKQHGGKSAAKVSLSIVLGQVTTSIRECITKKKIDLVVMGTQGASGLKEFFIGSNTEKIARFSSAPVVAVRKAAKLTSLKNIVFPVDTNIKQSAALVKKVKELQKLLKFKLNILTVNTPEFFRRDPDVKLALEGFVSKNKLTNCTLNIRSDNSEPKGIIAFADEIGADMIIMGTHGRRGLAHLLSGSVTEDVINRVTCPIWTYVMK